MAHVAGRLSFLLRILLNWFLTLFIASFLIFFVLLVLPGDAAALRLGVRANADLLYEQQQSLDLLNNPFQRYLDWMGGLFTGNFGTSINYNVPVATLLKESLSLTVPLAFYASFLTFFIAMILLYCYYSCLWLRIFINSFAQLLLAVPNFCLALFFIFVFVLRFSWFSVGGFSGWQEGFLRALHSLTLPALALALPQTAVLLRLLIKSLHLTMEKNFIRSARSKGLNEIQLFNRHALAHILLPLSSLMGMQMSYFFAGSIIIENTFSLPGFGKLLVQSLAQRDLAVVAAGIMLIFFMVVFIQFLAEFLQSFFAQRLR